jgi:protein-S-isoprenylcysteine O-methyltransferase Ste14
MILFTILLTSASAIWIAFEIWLMVRDRIQGKGKTANDKGTRYYNFIAIAVGITFASIVNGNPRFFFPGGRGYAGFWIGLSIMVVGFCLRIWAVATLGASFRTTVETHSNQQVVRTGPYKLVRHPSYSGLMIMCCGYGIALMNWLSLVIAVVPPLVALIYRIHVEEEALASSIGSEYKEYQRHTRKLIPWVW